MKLPIQSKSNQPQKHQTIKRRIIAFSVLTLLFIAYVIYGNTAVTVSHYDVRSEKIPPEFDGFRIVQISDLHNSGYALMTSSLVKKTKEASPDVIFLTGDAIDRRLTDVNKAFAVIEKLAEIAPVYYVTGNHEASTGEYYRLSKALNKRGVIELNNAFLNLRINEDEIVIAGIDDPMMAHKKRIPEEVTAGQWLGSLGHNREMFTVLLSHRPELINTYEANGVDLVFSGHAHGGLIRIPFIGGVYSPHQGLFPKYAGGIYRKGSTQMIVSRGVANTGYSFRINDNPELVVAVLHAGK